MAEIRFLRVDEEALVEEAGALERLAPNEHERAGRPVARHLCLVDVDIELSLAQPARPNGQALGAECLGERAERVRRAPDGREELPVGVTCFTPASPTSGRASIAATSSSKVPSRISVSGLRNRTYRAAHVSSARLFACAKPRFAQVTRRASGNRSSTSSLVPSVDPLSATTTSRSAEPACPKTVVEARSQPTCRVGRDDDDRKVVHGVGSALPPRACSAVRDKGLHPAAR